MTDSQKEEWLKKQVIQTIADMEKTGIPVDRSKIVGVSRGYERGELADYNRKTKKITVQDNADRLTVAHLHGILAHEIDHSQKSAPHNDKEKKAHEKAGNHATAQTYGAQRAIDWLEIEAKMFAAMIANNSRKRLDGSPDPHGSTRDPAEAD